MNYTLQIDLGDGFAKTDAYLDKLLSKVGQLGNLENIQMDKLIDESGFLKAGEEAGENMVGGIKKKLKSFNILDAWGKASFKGLNDFWNNAVKNGTSAGDGKGTIKGLREPGGADLAKVLNLPDINSLTEIKKGINKFHLLIGGMATLFNPFVGSRVLSDVVMGKGGAAGAGGAGSLMGASGSVGAAGIFIAVKALELEFNSLIKIAHKLSEAIDFAHKIYGEALTQGLSLKFLTGRKLTADVLGISEQDVPRMKQSAYVMARLQEAIAKISSAAPNLAYTSAQFSILKYDLLGVASTIADRLTPAINGFAIILDKLIKTLDSPIVEKLAKTALAGVSNVILGDVNTLLGKLGVNLGSNLLTAIGKADLAKNGSGFGQPQSFMKQLPASTWEKMGLVVGGGQNQQLEVAKQSRNYLKVIASSITQGTLPRGNQAFGMNIATGNP